MIPQGMIAMVFLIKTPKNLHPPASLHLLYRWPYHRQIYAQHSTAPARPHWLPASRRKRLAPLNLAGQHITAQNQPDRAGSMLPTGKAGSLILVQYPGGKGSQGQGQCHILLLFNIVSHWDHFPRLATISQGIILVHIPCCHYVRRCTSRSFPP